ncbi:ABC transporter ATP-binding protein [Salinibacter ruber]|uniref:ABC transporter ATP-binding protein n=1 Tax=Salinibacter ruber TaxID=146919 RepID=UPI002168B1B6|nr:ATP-binding cassette domain-containing protein [Salinibacter ruber]MCS3698313.1 phospholipid/cholesterol/gamma-HCH transport system ATP-binding protein [Salinibacter ruber]
MIEVENVHKSFEDTEVLTGVDLEIEDCNLFAIIGHSGSGKSVLLRHLVGLLRPDRGVVRVGNANLAGLSDEELEAVRRRFGMLFQGGALFDSMTVFENVALPLRLLDDRSDAAIEERVMTELERVEIAGAADQMPASLSGGQVKRASLARAIVREPKYLFYDEPSSGLDPRTSSVIDDLIQKLSQTLCRMGVMVTHDMHSVLSVADKVGFLHEGTMRFVGSVEELRRCDDPVLCDFLEANAYQL